MCVCVFASLSVLLYICACVCVCEWLSECGCLDGWMFMHLSLSLSLSLCMCVCINLYLTFYQGRQIFRFSGEFRFFWGGGGGGSAFLQLIFRFFIFRKITGLRLRHYGHRHYREGACLCSPRSMFPQVHVPPGQTGYVIYFMSCHISYVMPYIICHVSCYVSCHMPCHAICHVVSCPEREGIEGSHAGHGECGGCFYH